MSRSFALAPMSPIIKGTTLVVLLIPPIFGLISLIAGPSFLGLIALLITILYVAVWLGCRPTHFIVTSSYLQIVFPLWQRRIPWSEVVKVSSLSLNQFQPEFGWAIRIGVGGLWGVFGWLWTQNHGLVEIYVSRTDQFTMIERRSGQRLLISPVSIDQFASAAELSIRHYQTHAGANSNPGGSPL